MEGVVNKSFAKELAVLEQQFEAMQPELEVTVRDPQLGVEGYVVVWNTAISLNGPLSGCGKGGTRIVPNLTLDEVKMLARTMALKNAAAGLPLGGAKSGLRADVNAADFERIYRRFVHLVKPNLYENGGIFGGFGFDIGGRPEHAIWACDELKSTRSFTGKPLELGGTDYDRQGIAGLGVSVSAETALAFEGHQVSNQTFAVQGLGAMGSAIVRYFSETGARLKAVSDLRLGGTYILHQSPSRELIDAISNQRIPEVESILRDQASFSADTNAVLFADVDILFPAAVQHVITESNFSSIQAKYIIEGANNPCSDSVRLALHANSKLVIPDFIANPGGIIAAFVELTSSVSIEENIRTQAKVKEAVSYTREKIGMNVRDVLASARAHGVAPLLAARHLALTRMFAI